MKVFASFRYQLADQKRGILTYYGVLLGFYVLFEILFVVAAVGEDVNGLHYKRYYCGYGGLRVCGVTLLF